MKESNHLSLNHITLNTGHKRISHIKDFDKRMFFMMNRFYVESFNGCGADLGNGYNAKSIKDRNSNVICTVYSNGTPVITTGVAINDSDNKLWETLHSTSESKLVTSIDDPPEIYPYIAERLDIGAVADVFSLSWVGDFTKAIAWVHLASKELKMASFAHNNIFESKYLRFFK